MNAVRFFSIVALALGARADIIETEVVIAPLATPVDAPAAADAPEKTDNIAAAEPAVVAIVVEEPAAVETPAEAAPVVCETELYLSPENQEVAENVARAESEAAMVADFVDSAVASMETVAADPNLAKLENMEKSLKKQGRMLKAVLIVTPLTMGLGIAGMALTKSITPDLFRRNKDAESLERGYASGIQKGLAQEPISYNALSKNYDRSKFLAPYGTIEIDSSANEPASGANLDKDEDDDEEVSSSENDDETYDTRL